MIIGDHNQNYNFYEKDKKTKLKCMLCGKEWLIESNNSIIETISGYTFYFDSKDCSTIFKRLNHVYGNYFVENIINNIQYISDPFLHNNFSSEEETINEENGETKPPYIKVINNKNYE